MIKIKQFISKVILPFVVLSFMAVKIENPGGIFPTYGDNSFGSVILKLIMAALGIAALLAMAFLIYGGFQYITSRGNEEQTEAGKKTITSAIIGLVIIILSYAIIAVILNALLPTGAGV